MIKTLEIDGKDMTVIVLGEKGSVEINDYRKALLNMFEMATLWSDFNICINEGEMWTVLKFLQSLGFPEEEETISDNVIRAVQAKYNATFDGILPPSLRLTKYQKENISLCLKHYGEDSVDVVFEQIKHDPFLLGENKNGFIATFQHIFNVANYGKYFERAKIRRKEV